MTKDLMTRFLVSCDLLNRAKFLLYDSKVIDDLSALWSISSTFYGRIFHTKVLFRQNITREKHRHLWKKALLYKKRAHKMLMKLTPDQQLQKSF